MNENDLIKRISISSREDFEKAIQLTKKLIKEKIITVDINVPYPWGIDFTFKRDRLEQRLGKENIAIKPFTETLSEIESMFIANLLASPHDWAMHQINRVYKDELEGLDENEINDVGHFLLSRCQLVSEQLIDKSLEEVILLRKSTKNKIFSDIDWEINHKLFDRDNIDSQLTPFATLKFSFYGIIKDFPPPFSYLIAQSFGQLPKDINTVTVDFTLYDLDNFINKLTEIKSKLKEMIT